MVCVARCLTLREWLTRGRTFIGILSTKGDIIGLLRWALHGLSLRHTTLRWHGSILRIAIHSPLWVLCRSLGHRFGHWTLRRHGTLRRHWALRRHLSPFGHPFHGRLLRRSLLRHGCLSRNGWVRCLPILGRTLRRHTRPLRHIFAYHCFWLIRFILGNSTASATAWRFAFGLPFSDGRGREGIDRRRCYRLMGFLAQCSTSAPCTRMRGLLGSRILSSRRDTGRRIVPHEGKIVKRLRWIKIVGHDGFTDRLGSTKSIIIADRHVI